MGSINALVIVISGVGCAVFILLIVFHRLLDDWFLNKQSQRGTYGVPLKPHPPVCPNCESDQVYYGRFVPGIKHGEYCCDDCGWGIDAFTGKLHCEGANFSQGETDEDI